MKKIYVSFLGLLAIGSFSAQVNNSNVAPLAKKNSAMVGTIKKTTPKPATAAEKATILWQDDFSTAGNWVLNNTGLNPAGWEFSTDPAVIPVGALAPMASTTAANGFLFVNSDANNSADNDGFDIVSTATNATPIDLTGQLYVKLKYQHNFRWYKDTRGVRVSGDNGATWTEYEMSNVSSYTTPNQNSGNPEVTSIDISAVAGGSSQVLVQFYYNDNDIWAWYWAVDDVSIEVLEDYDLTLVSPYWGSTGAWGARLPYFQIPTSQVAPVDFSGAVRNSGAALQTDATVTAAVGAFTSTSAPATIIQASTDTLACPTQWTPAAGANTINMSTTSGQTDSYTADNALAPFSLNVGGYVYSRDNGVADNGTYNQGQGFEAGNIYDVYTAATLQAVDVHIEGAAVAGAEIYAKVYSIDAATGDFIYANESAPYVLTAADLDADLTLPLLTEQALNAGEPYLVVVGSYGDGGASNDLVLATSGQSEANTSYYFDMTDQTWYYTTSTPMVRMNFDPAVGINEVAKSSVLSVYPNPANTSATVSFDVANGAEVSVNVTDLSGKVVYTNVLGSVKGTQKVTLNTEVLNSGIYMVNVTMNGAVSTKKLVVKK
jgi:hypothetical protein